MNFPQGRGPQIVAQGGAEGLGPRCGPERWLAGILFATPLEILQTRILAAQGALASLCLVAGEVGWMLFFLLGPLAALLVRWRRLKAPVGAGLSFLVLCAPLGHAFGLAPGLGLVLLVLGLVQAGVVGRVLRHGPL